MLLTPAECAAQDAAARRERLLAAACARSPGIVHTPPELARFMARVAHQLVRSELGLSRGLADPALSVVDPACGPGAFLSAVAAVTVAEPVAAVALQPASVRPIRIESFSMHGADLDGGALELAKDRVLALLSQMGLHCSLQHCDTLRDLCPASVGRARPAVCVLGNPPWIGTAQLPSAPAMDALLEDFRRDSAGQRLVERKLGVLADAYVRFVRWACEAARHAPLGAVVALVTNASYLDGPVHRGMRAALRRYFSSLHLVDLGGSALLARAGARDENVFGVRPSVAVLFGVRRRQCDERAAAQVHYVRLHGTRRAKLERLADATLSDLQFRELSIAQPYQRFVPGPLPSPQYASWPSLSEAMPFHREGVQTNRDAVVIDRDRARLLARLEAFAAGGSALELEVAARGLAHYDPERARERVREMLARDPDGSRGLVLRPIAYRPFDRRWFAPIAPLCHRPRPDLLLALDRSRFALVTVRKDRSDVPYAQFFASRDAIDNCLLSTRSSCRARAFPTHDAAGAQNLAPEVARAFERCVGQVISSEQFACYALAMLASKRYRQGHDHALHVDYPRIPPPENRAEFDRRVQLGQRLVELMAEPLAEPLADDRAVDTELGSASARARDFSFGHHRPLAAADDPVLLARVRAVIALIDAAD
jgi:hypothetical protein